MSRGRKPSRERPIKVSASRRILEIRSSIGRHDLLINSSLVPRDSQLSRSREEKRKELARNTSRRNRSKNNLPLSAGDPIKTSIPQQPLRSRRIVGQRSRKHCSWITPLACASRVLIAKSGTPDYAKLLRAFKPRPRLVCTGCSVLPGRWNHGGMTRTGETRRERVGERASKRARERRLKSRTRDSVCR